jgi:ribosomal protein S18 acetylase RimI-like enzyme
VSTAHSVETAITIRRATPDDAPSLVAILQGIAAERVYSAIDVPWTIEQQQRYLAVLSPREAIHVAVTGCGEIVGFQTLDLWAPTLTSMAHVGQLGTFLAPEWRRRGVGKELFRASEDLARNAQYSKMVIQVRAMNEPAKAFYQRLGFVECGRLAKQVRIDGAEDHEILMELFL